MRGLERRFKSFKRKSVKIISNPNAKFRAGFLSFTLNLSSGGKCY